MTSLTLEQKISFLKIVFSFMNLDGVYDDDEEKAIEVLKNKVFKIDVKENQYKVITKEKEDLKNEFLNLDSKTQKSLLTILDEIVKKNKYEDSKFFQFFQQSKKKLESKLLFDFLKNLSNK